MVAAFFHNPVEFGGFSKVKSLFLCYLWGIRLQAVLCRLDCWAIQCKNMTRQNYPKTGARLLNLSFPLHLRRKPGTWLPGHSWCWWTRPCSAGLSKWICHAHMEDFVSLLWILQFMQKTSNRFHVVPSATETWKEWESPSFPKWPAATKLKLLDSKLNCRRWFFFS